MKYIKKRGYSEGCFGCLFDNIDCNVILLTSI